METCFTWADLGVYAAGACGADCVEAFEALAMGAGREVAMRKSNHGEAPVPGRVYNLTGPGPSIMNGNTWAESEVAPESEYETARKALRDAKAHLAKVRETGDLIEMNRAFEAVNRARAVLVRAEYMGE